MRRLPWQQIALIALIVVIAATARGWPWPLQAVAVAAAAAGFATLAWRAAGGTLPGATQRPRVTYWRGRPVEPAPRPGGRLRPTPAVWIYAGLACCCLAALAALLMRLLR